MWLPVQAENAAREGGGGEAPAGHGGQAGREQQALAREREHRAEEDFEAFLLHAMRIEQEDEIVEREHEHVERDHHEHRRGQVV